GLLLERLGHKVRVANDGPNALELIFSWRPSVVFLDIGMPGMDGNEVARRTRIHFDDREMTLIALTGWGQDEARRRCNEAGFSHQLIKPVERSELQTLLATTKPRSGARS